MVTMDFKGLTWVGNVYDKFEAMCLEVEEAMYQDTVQYVGNQVQTVGANVKKFYSDVMHDLLLPSSVDHVKIAAADVSLNPYGDFGIHKKPKVGIKEDSKKDDKQGMEDLEVIGAVNVGQGSSFSGFNNADRCPRPSSLGLVRGTGSEDYLGQKEERGSCERSNVVVRRKSKRNSYLTSEISRSNAPASNNASLTPLCRKISENHEAVCDRIAVTSHPVSDDIANCNSGGGKFHSKFVSSSSHTAVSSNTPISDTNFQVESGKEKVTKLKNPSVNVQPDGLSEKFIVAGSSSGSGVDSKVTGQSYSNTKYSEPSSEDCLTHEGPSVDVNTDVIVNNSDLTELELETIQQCDKQNLEETCVLVDREKLNFITQVEDKPRSYKKKIREALSLKRSSRKQEYKKLAVHHGVLGGGSTQGSALSAGSPNPNFTEAETEKSPTHGFCESEWELL